MSWLARLWTCFLIHQAECRRDDLLRTRMILKKGIADTDEKLKAASLQLVGLRLLRKVGEETCSSIRPLNWTPTSTRLMLNVTDVKSWS